MEHIRSLPATFKGRHKLHRMIRAQVFKKLAHLKHGSLKIIDPWGVIEFGEDGGLHAEIRITDPEFYRSLCIRGALGAAESYIRDEWRTQDLVSIIRTLVLNQEILQGFEGGIASLQKPAMAMFSYLTRNTQEGSQKNIKAHYDLSNDLFKLFLDPSMMYSCAYYPSPTATLEEAQQARLHRVCQKMNLSPGDHVLEIGTGWGGFAIHAAEHYGCRVTTTTISQEQFDYAHQEIKRRGLDHKIQLLKQDYRDLQGTYDKVVSLEMIEAVGAEFLPTYMAKCASLLKDDGLFFLQAITINDQLYNRALKEIDFIKKYIFPGSFIPSIYAILEKAKLSTDLRLYSQEDLAPHYARTLLDWRQRFLWHTDEIKGLGFDDQFIRMWDYYFCYCAGGFLERSIGLSHMVFGKPGFRTDLSQPLNLVEGVKS